LVDIGRSLSIEVVAEGVETMEQAKILCDLGCDILQGYAFARPMPAETLEDALRTQRWRQAS
jgi:EAL domain-containing protein (putative c-di-GMP-specific phosphodiesterase class I)